MAVPNWKLLTIMAIVLGLVPPSLCLDRSSKHNVCKTTPKDKSWPSISQWSELNTTLSGRLISATPPALACHLSESSSANNASCGAVTKAWRSYSFHQNNPVSTAWNNMNNDTCLPDPSVPCSGIGYPIYVVNATDANHVKSAVDFARAHNIRLNVKASGHDYLKRTSSPNSLSIWTRYMIGEPQLHDSFTPQGCNHCINTTAVSVGAGSSVNDMYTLLAPHNLTVVDGMGPEVSMGGYVTGGGHSPLSHIYGLGADQVYEVEMVTPKGAKIVANECQNEDIFWAVRGGGGGTFGVLVRVTVRTVPSYPLAVYDLELQGQPNSSSYWNAVNYVVSQLSSISSHNISAFNYLYPNTTGSQPGQYVSSFQAIFLLPNPTFEKQLEVLINPILQHIQQKFSKEGLNATGKPMLLPDFISAYDAFKDDTGAGVDKVVGSRLLPPEVLIQDGFKDALIKFIGPAGGRLYMVSGKGVWNAKPRGGSNAVNPAWRKALIHAVTSQNWTPLDNTERATVEDSVNHVQTSALRKLTPGSGAYLNEAYWDEPNFQQSFWGSHYPRLLEIKKTVDPDNLLWCHTCVGSEDWKQVRYNICKA